ncbi:phosphoribosylformylglycinamidine synthase subunit PurS [Gephyromycinifex aptenodytis]|uniref:phosphoribosylformylglycinamidine synthase subunit PurS n=1 Tax=Gephyromycinifex aptenodytis TaxID=2716227 RepID=UPI0014459DE7|nr:phosphoribosylformylglycinamidine synthase subunit PurS [Gephyromycinifex aptenodytis]
MGTVVVDIMPKSETPDPDGQTAAAALSQAGVSRFTEVRQGRRVVLSVAGEVTPAILVEAEHAARTVLSDSQTEEVVSVRAAGDATDLDDDVTTDWDDMPEHWGGVDTVPSEAGEYQPRPMPRHPKIDESMLGHVESGSYYGRAEDVK